MSLEREMKLVSPANGSAVHCGQPVLRIAIATSDLEHVDQHFGSASRLAKFEVTSDSSQFVGVCVFSETRHDGNESKLVEKLRRLRGQHAVLSTAIGGSAVRQLIAAGIQPIKLGEESAIVEVLEYFQREVELGSTPWVNKALSSSTGESTDPLEAYLQSDWNE